MADHRSADRRNGGSTGAGGSSCARTSSGDGSTRDDFGTEEVEPLVGTIGQPDALDAIEYGLVARRLASYAARLRAFAAMEAGVLASGEEEA